MLFLARLGLDCSQLQLIEYMANLSRVEQRQRVDSEREEVQQYTYLNSTVGMAWVAQFHNETSICSLLGCGWNCLILSGHCFDTGVFVTRKIYKNLHENSIPSVLISCCNSLFCIFTAMLWELRCYHWDM